MHVPAADPLPGSAGAVGHVAPVPAESVQPVGDPVTLLAVLTAMTSVPETAATPPRLHTWMV